MKQKILLMLLAVLPLTTFAQQYEGERNKDGQPDGQGVMCFKSVTNGVIFDERIEGTFKKGVPQKGKAYRTYRKDGRPKYIFEGKFKLKKEGVLRNLADLLKTGNIIFYYYEDGDNYKKYGYEITWGPYKNNDMKNYYGLSCKDKTMYYITNDRVERTTTQLTAEAKRLYDELYSHVGSAWIFDRNPEFDGFRVKRKQDSFVKLDNIHWAGSVKNGFIDGKANGFLSMRTSEDGTLNYTFEGEFREGVPVNVTIERKYYWDKNGWYNSRKDNSTVQVSTGNLRNNLRPFLVKSISGSSHYSSDTSYEGYVDENFKFKSDYCDQARKEQIEKENQAWGALFGAVAKAVGTTAKIANEIAPQGSGSVEIDWSNSKEPSGDLTTTVIGGGHYTHLNKGIIKIKNGNRYSYNKVYGDSGGKNFWYYEVSGPKVLNKRCKTKEEMIDAIIKGESGAQ